MYVCVCVCVYDKPSLKASDPFHVALLIPMPSGGPHVSVLAQQELVSTYSFVLDSNNEKSWHKYYIHTTGMAVVRVCTDGSFVWGNNHLPTHSASKHRCQCIQLFRRFKQYCKRLVEVWMLLQHTIDQAVQSAQLMNEWINQSITSLSIFLLFFLFFFRLLHIIIICHVCVCVCAWLVHHHYYNLKLKLNNILCTTHSDSLNTHTHTHTHTPTYTHTHIAIKGYYYYDRYYYNIINIYYCFVHK